METVDWDKRYREGFYDGATEPHHLLQQFWYTIPRGPVADIAMGNGRNALFLAEKGYTVCGLDGSPEALKIAGEAAAAKGQNVSRVLADANDLPFKGGTLAGAIVFYFLQRNIMGEIADTLQSGGVLIYETFLKRQNEIDRHRNPEFLLDDGELISYFKGLDLLFYEETISDIEGRNRATAKFVGRKR
jgi:SAM-dependent methyltransferase